MKTTADYIDALRVKLNVDSDFLAMHALGVDHRTQVSRWRKCKGTFDKPLSFKVADTLGIDRAEVWLAMEYQKESNAEMKKLLARLASMASGVTVAVVFAVILSASVLEVPVLESGAYVVSAVSSNIHYANIDGVELAVFSLLIFACWLGFPRNNPPKK